MKKLITIILILALILPAVATADYSPFFDMTMREYLAKYNSISAPLGSPYAKLESPYMWTKYGNMNVAWFMPAKSSSVILLLLSKDPEHSKTLDSGLDMIQICTDKNEDIIDLISITERSIEPFAANLFGVSFGDLRVGQLIRYYYENGYKDTNGYAYWAIDDDEKIILKIFMTEGWTYFQLSSEEDAK